MNGLRRKREGTKSKKVRESNREGAEN